MNQFLRAFFALGLAGLIFSGFPMNGVQTASAQGGPWTAWLDRDDPSGKGDYETVKDFLIEGKMQPNPVAIQCQTLAGVDWNGAGQVYSCTVEVGGVCRNAEQVDGEQCKDYKVRFRYKKTESHSEEEYQKKK